MTEKTTTKLKKRKSTKYRYLIILFLLIIFMSLTLCKTSNWISENIFSKGISRWWISSFGKFFSNFEFSVYEVLATIFVVYIVIALISIVVNVLRGRFYKANRKLSFAMIVCLLILNVYTVSAGFSYYRQDITIEQYQERLTKAEAEALSDYFLNDFNYLASKMTFDENGIVVSPYSFEEIAKIMQEETSKMDSEYFSQYSPLAKSMFFSEFMSYQNIVGLFFAPTGEVNINKDVPVVSLPSTIAHETAHAKGVMREDEAELFASYVTLSSSNEFVRYCGYIEYGYQFTNIAYYETNEGYYPTFLARLHPSYVAVNKYVTEYWKKYSTIIDDISDWFNDLYLKFSGVEEGTDSYDVSGDAVDTGEKDDEGEPIFVYYYSDIQKMIMEMHKDVIFDAE